MKKNKKNVYIAFSADILHEGHINILKQANKLGEVVVGLLTDEAIVKYKKLPNLTYQERENELRKIKYVKKIVKQTSLDYSYNLKKLKPHYVVHGDDWKKGIQKKTRNKVIKTLKGWGGKLVEIKFTKEISELVVKKKSLEVGTTPQKRQQKLKRLMSAKKLVRIIESHSALTGLIVENLYVIKNDTFFDFDGMWSSSLTDSAIKGKPDNQSVDYSTRIIGLNDMLDVTTKPLVFDGDNGGRIEHIPFMIKTLDRLGVSAVILEDKVGLKKNSLFKNQSGVKQDAIKDFCKKISVAKSAQVSKDFMVIARIESFILGKSTNDAIKRANQYSKAGADAILIHSKESTPKQIFSFAKKFRKSNNFIPLIAVPSTYSKVTEKKLIENGFKIVIYANHMLRASYPGMVDVAKSILQNQRSHEFEKKLIPIKKIIQLVK